MKTTMHIIGRTFVLGAFVALAGVVVAAPQTSAHDGEDHTVKATKVATKTRVYSYTANSGDTYTQLVRKAVQTYGIVHKESLGNARIVAIETTASERAGWPMIAEGQVVSFDESTVKAWAADAKKLSDADVAAWATYVPYIDFDTRGIGE